ncbi:zinc ribbon domain-containing protein [Oscillatoria sp. FACHB-1407]|uniref:zinc ribbon domain-containing protein n=1 Tax=Oscillatoria sp. FACHB-1407 TaxID=2692847 RepID=UPI001684427A|nr:zinc ribbon domain-containing protein [Oscillatoria sp. FACHB-1407]MBD2465289.1 zinc ribbon domain-containing protein [Oscillatoria sp. FACHB-1407]
MLECPRCHQPVDTQAIACPYCRTTLKAHGHPGITLYRATGKESLCSTCTYHEDDTCNFPQRPFAKECTLYHDRSQPILGSPPAKPRDSFRLWAQRNAGWLFLTGLILVSLLIALSNR